MGSPTPWDVTLAVATLVVVAAAIMARRHLGRRWPSGAHIPEVAVLLSALAVLCLSMMRIDGWASAAGHEVPTALVLIAIGGWYLGVVVGLTAAAAFLVWLVQTVRSTGRRRLLLSCFLAIATLAMLSLALSYLVVFGNSL